MKSRGFTLIEALVAVAILALVAVLAWRATASMTDSEARLSVESVRWQTLDASMTRLAADLRASIPRRARHGSAIEPAWLLDRQDATGNATLVFTRAGPDAYSEPGVGGQRIGYRLREGRIEALYWPQIDNPSTIEPFAFTLVDGVAAFRIAALAGQQRSDRWPVTGGPELPEGVRVELTFTDGSTIERWFALQ